MRLSSRVKLISTFVSLLVVAASIAIFGATKGIGHAAGTTSNSSTTSNCGSWHIVPDPPMDSGNFGFGGVVAVSSNNVWAVGNFIEHWDGTKWSKVKSNVGLNGGGLNGVAA